MWILRLQGENGFEGFKQCSHHTNFEFLFKKSPLSNRVTFGFANSFARPA